MSTNIVLVLFQTKGYFLTLIFTAIILYSIDFNVKNELKMNMNYTYWIRYKLDYYDLQVWYM